MSQRFVIEGDRKLGINVTVAVEGVNDDGQPGWPWGSMVATIVGIVLLAGLLMLVSGLPYFNTGTALDANASREHPWMPLLECRYRGPQGDRSLAFGDASSCPAIVFLPWRSATPPVPAVAPNTAPATATKPDRHARKALCFGLAGPLDPDHPDKACQRW